MKSKLALALVSALALSAAMPAVSFAEQTRDRGGDSQRDFSTFRSDAILRALQDRGINATSVEPWGGLIRAYVQTDHGIVMEFFNPGSLTPAQ